MGAVFQKQYFDDHPYDPNVKDYSEQVFIAIFSMMFGAMAAGQAQQFGPDLGKAKTAAAKIFGIMDLPSKINAMDNTTEAKRVDPKSFRGEIEFQNVWFRYPTRKNDWVLKGLNLKINPNETVALVGESGCGKSTLVSLLLRFYDVDEGEILIDGVNIKFWDLPSLRKAMGLVQQEPTLFNYTVAENIIYGESYAKNSEIRAATQVANATEFIESHEIENAVDDSADSLFNEFTRFRDALIYKMGQDSYDETMNILTEIRIAEEKKGKFVAVEGDIDRRGAEKKNIKLHNGYSIQCGIKGSKLSGG